MPDLGPLAPILPALEDTKPSRDWGDVKEDVLRLIEAWQKLADVLADGGPLLGAIRQATESIEELERVLDVTWHRTLPAGELVAQAGRDPRRWRYRAC